MRGMKKKRRSDLKSERPPGDRRDGAGGNHYTMGFTGNMKAFD